MARVAAAICTYDRYTLLPGAIDRLLRQSVPHNDYDIIVVDNSPDHDRARAFARCYAGFDNLTYLIEATPGLSNARNVAVGACRAEFLAFVDDDALASPDWLRRLLEAFDGFGARAAVVGGKVLPVWQAPRPRWLHDDALGYLSIVDWGEGLREAAQDEWFAGTNVAYRVAALVAAGRFATHLGRNGTGVNLLSNEELEVTARIKAAGGRLVYQGAAVVEHVIPAERLTPAWFRRRVAWQAVSDMLSNPDAVLAKLGNASAVIGPYLESSRRSMGPLQQLARDTDDAEQFFKQLQSIYLVTAKLLAGLGQADQGPR